VNVYELNRSEVSEHSILVVHSLDKVMVMLGINELLAEETVSYTLGYDTPITCAVS